MAGRLLLVALMQLCLLCAEHPNEVLAVRASDLFSPSPSSQTAVFALGSFWRAEAVFGCLAGVIRTTAGYTGGSKPNPEYRNVGDHVEAVELEYDPHLISYQQLLEAFWLNHDPTQFFGQGPDVGDQYRSVIFFDGPEQEKLASWSKEKEEAKLVDRLLMTKIHGVRVFYPAEAEHQKFELRRKVQLMQVLGNVAEEEFSKSHIATKLNGYAAGMCPFYMQRQLDNLLDVLLNCRPDLHQILQ